MVWNPESTALVWNPESRILESGIPGAGIRNPGPSWILLHGATRTEPSIYRIRKLQTQEVCKELTFLTTTQSTGQIFTVLVRSRAKVDLV